MKPERIEETQPPKQRKKPRSGARPRRVGEHGPIGFGTVMRDITGGGAQGGAKAQHQDSTALSALLAMGAVPSTEQLVIAAASSNANLSVDGTESLIQVNAKEPALPTHLGRMTPAALLTKVVDEATKLAIEQASKELHVELEPAHLGPLVVSLKREQDGRLDVRFRARRADAARVLDAGSDLLRERLADAGFTGARIAVDLDEDLTLGA